MTQAEFDQKLEAGKLAITLVGMSNVGKTYWSKRLAAEKGFEHFCCDDLIESELHDVLRELGYRGIRDMAKWLGQPYDERFAENQQTYLDLEMANMESIINQLQQGRQEGNIVIDTTGSVVHTSQAICRKLSELTAVVYLEATSDMQREMFKLYIAEPKPVVWGNIYEAKKGELPQEALAGRYPQLLTHRSRLYKEMSEVSIPRRTAMSIPDSNDFLNRVKNKLSK